MGKELYARNILEIRERGSKETFRFEKYHIPDSWVITYDTGSGLDQQCLIIPEGVARLLFENGLKMLGVENSEPEPEPFAEYHQIFKLLETGQVKNAIKMLREVDGLSLQEAKDIICQSLDEQPAVFQEAYAPLIDEMRRRGYRPTPREGNVFI